MVLALWSLPRSVGGDLNVLDLFIGNTIMPQIPEIMGRVIITISGE